MELWCRLFIILFAFCYVVECKQKCTSCSGKPKVLCYFTSWAWYRSGIGKFYPKDINTTLCTHVIYGFVSLNNNTLTIQPGDEWADITNKFFTQITALNSKGVQAVASLGGWSDSEGDKYSRLVNNPAARKTFIANSILFLEKYGFTGLELDWEYPKCHQGDCKAGPVSDKKNFGVFIKELKEAYEPNCLTVSAAVPASKKLIDNGFDVPTLSCYMDWINVMTYEYHSAADGVTGADSTFFDDKNMGTVQSLKYWESKGATKCKLNVGVSFYGHTFTLKNVSNHELGAPVSGKGVAGPYTGNEGTLSYYEICLNIKNNGYHSVSTWTDSTYAYKGDQWISYGDVGDVEDRTWLVKREGYGGAFFWALDYDDFTNVCGCGKYPLLTTLARELLGLDVPRVQCY